MRNLIAIALCSLLALPLAAQDVPKPTIQEQVVQIAQGAAVEIRLKKPKEKLRGRLSEITADGFTMLIAKGSQLMPRSIAFDQVKSIRQLEHRTGNVTHVFAVIGILVVASTVISLVGCGTKGCY